MTSFREAQAIPWHPRHVFGAVDANGDYCRFIDEPRIAFGKCWIGSAVYQPQSGDVICKVSPVSDWKSTLHKCPKPTPVPRDALIIICDGMGSKPWPCGWRGYIDDVGAEGRCPHCKSTTHWETSGG